MCDVVTLNTEQSSTYLCYLFHVAWTPVERGFPYINRGGARHFFSRAFLQWQVVTGMEAEQMIESLAIYIWFLRAPNAVYISHLLLIAPGNQFKPIRIGENLVVNYNFS